MTTDTLPEMPNHIALEFVRGSMEPYQASWSGQWLWEQPAEGEMIRVGGIYGSPPHSFTVKEIVGAIDSEKKSEDLAAFTAAAQRLLGLGFNDEDTGELYYVPDTTDIIASQHIAIPYDKMELFDRVLYRFAMMFVNGPNDGHNWACEFLEELGCRYFDEAIEPVMWEGHDCDGDLSTFLEEIRKRGYSFPAERDRNYSADTFLTEDSHTRDWLREYDKTNNIFPDEIVAGDREELIKLMAYAMDEASDSWDSGDLKFGKDAPAPILAWMQLHNIESIEIKPSVWDMIRDGTLGNSEVG